MHGRTRLVTCLAALASLGLLSLAPTALAVCGPKPGLIQFVSNPRSPDADYGDVSTIHFICPSQGCHNDWTRTNPNALVVWEVSNDFDEHYRICPWDPLSTPLCGPDNHGWHKGYGVTSTLRVPEAPQTSEMAWFLCPRDII